MSLFSYQCQERSCKSLQNDNDYLEEKICQFKKSKSGYISTLTRVINKPPDYINLNSDINVIKRYKTTKCYRKHDITTKLHESMKDKNEIQNPLKFCIKQEFRVIQIYKSLNEHTHATIGKCNNNLNKTKVSKSSNS